VHQPFDEQLFPPVPEEAESYAGKVAQGYGRMATNRVVLVGLARNVATCLPATMSRMEELGNCFADYRVLIYENDSADATVSMLDAWARDNRRVCVQSDLHGDPQHAAVRCSHRAQRMACYRNACQQSVLKHWPDFDHVILIDTDLAGGWSLDGIANTFGHDHWDFVGSFGIIYKRRGLNINRYSHYDAWAYRNDALFTPLPTKYVNRILYRRGEPMVPLYSCFGGLGVYTMRAYRAGVYAGDDIEHVGFHRSLREAGLGRQFLNPSQIVVYGRKHRQLDDWVARGLRWAWRLGIAPNKEWLFGKHANRLEGTTTSPTKQLAA
jgi:hypothetical protein